MKAKFSGELGRYRLGRLLGPPGGFGAAYVAERDDGLHCVVKLIHGFQNPHPDEVERLEVVMARLTTVDSPHVVSVIDFGIEATAAGGALPWIAMPRLVGADSLKSYLDSKRPLDQRWIHKVLTGCALGLEALHGAGLLHRDFKPGNVLVDAGGRAWLIDFEILKVVDLTTKTNRAMEPLGTPLYMAPEQLLGPVVPATDLWALGLVVEEMFTGCHPLERYQRQGEAVLRRAICSAGLISGRVPAPYDQLGAALLRKMPSARPASAADVIRWLDDPARETFELLKPPRPKYRWTVANKSDFDAAELKAKDPELGSIDARNLAKGDPGRLSRAAKRLGVQLGIAPARVTPVDAPPTLDMAASLDIEDEFERSVAVQLARQQHIPQDVTLLPFVHVDDAGIEMAVHVLRMGARHRDLAQGRPLIGTLHCSTKLLADPARASALLAPCAALRIDGWRLMADGLQPRCGIKVMRAVQDAAEALACDGTRVWVRTSGVTRWMLLTVPGVSLQYRSGREIWTRTGGGFSSKRPERLEIDYLAGPVPRDIAERIAIVMPDVLRCPCPGCAGEALLPEPGPATINHNLYVLGSQIAFVRGADAGAVHDRIAAAIAARGKVGQSVEWHAELDDLAAVLKLIPRDEVGFSRVPRLLLAA